MSNVGKKRDIAQAIRNADEVTNKILANVELREEEFPFAPAEWLPSRDVDMLRRVRAVKQEDMEYTNANGYQVQLLANPTFMYVLDCYNRIVESDREDKIFTMICPNQWPGPYQALATMINRNNVSCRNVHAFAMDEWADADGNVAPLTYGAGLGYSFIKHFYMQIREDLRPPLDHWHVFTTENYKYFSDIIEDIGEGGADVCYSATGWPGHIAFIDPMTKEFAADSIEEFLEMGSRFVLQHPLTVCENSLFAPMGASGDVWAVPPGSVTIGPRDVANARYRLEMHNIVFTGGVDSWQRMISRIELYGPVSMDCPASIVKLFPGNCYVSYEIARPFDLWRENQNIFA